MFLNYASAEKPRSQRWFSGVVFRDVVLSCAVTILISGLGGLYRPLRAETELIVIDVYPSGEVASDVWLSSSEQQVFNSINQYFSQQPGLDTVQVSVLGHRNGEVIPLMTTVVSREQWQQLPQVSAWTRYHTPYALLERHDQERLVATTPLRPGNGIRSSAEYQIDNQAQIDQMIDAGLRSGGVNQQYLSDID